MQVKIRKSGVETNLLISPGVQDQREVQIEVERNGVTENFITGIEVKDQSEANVDLPLKIKFKLDKGAFLPTKTRPDDVGYDLTAIRPVKAICTREYLIGTGVYAAPPKGYYLEIVPHSLTGTGLMMTNSVEIIDPSYRGEILIAVTVQASGGRLHFPMKKFQLILRRQYLSETEVVESFDETEHGAGEFGSTDSKPVQGAPCIKK